MFIKPVSLTTKRISMERTFIRNSREKWSKKKIQKKAKKEKKESEVEQTRSI